MGDATEEFRAELNSVSAARRFVRRVLVGWGADGYEYEVSQVVTELATNSVIHAKTSFNVWLSLDGQILRLSVTDGSPRVPSLKRHSDQATTGRGMTVVEAFSDQWGVEKVPTGKTVWCTFTSIPSIAGRVT
jgi:anti-sigma regulatory factor (Ser/Thr protein kinase)